MQIKRNGVVEELVGEPVEVGETLPHFKVYDAQKNKVRTRDLIGKPVLLSVVPDINTQVCSIQTRKFNQTMDQYPEVRFVTISMNSVEDQANWCAAEGAENIEMMSDSEESFGYEMKLLVPAAGLLTRAVYLVDQDGKIIYRQIVDEQTDEPDYVAAVDAVKKLA